MHRSSRIIALLAAIVAVPGVLYLSSGRAAAATLLSDDFAGTTIDTLKWTEVDPGGTGGGAGDIRQNGSLTIANSFAASTWGQRALVSVGTFATTSLEISAVMTRASDQLLGYGDYNFQSPGTKAYIVDLVSGGSILALAWNNASLVANASCGSYTSGATFKMALTATGFDVYMNGVLKCSLTASIGIADKPVFLQSESAASTFDDVLVTGPSVGPSVPGAPTGLAADASSTQVGLTWSAPGSNGGSALLDYLVEYKTTATSTWSTFADGVSTATAATVSGLTNGTPYNFRVSAVNAAGTSTASSQVTSTPSAPTAPPAPSIGTATAGNAQATVTFSSNGSGGSPITSYVVTSNPGGLTATGSGSPITVSGLTNGTPYTFSVRAINAIGTSSASSDSSSVTPQALSNVLTDSFTGTTIDTGKWTEVDPGGTGGASGSITQNGVLSVGGSYSGGDWGLTSLISVDTFASTSLEISARVTSTGATLIGYGDSNFDSLTTKAYLIDLTGGTGSGILALAWQTNSYDSTACGTVTNGAVYAMKVVATGFEVYKDGVLQCTHTTSVRIADKPVFLQADGSGNTYDDLVVYGLATPRTAPGAPTGVSAVAGDSAASVSFSAPASTGGSPITSYVVTSNPGGLTATGSSSPITVSGLTNGTPYTFSVRAINAIGTSSASSDSSSVTPQPTPAPQQVTGLTALGVNRQALLSWTAPASSSTISDYRVEFKGSADAAWTLYADGVSTATKAIVNDLPNGTAFDFRVSATSISGTGTASAVATATPRAIGNLAFVITGESNSGGIAPNSSATSQELAPRSAVQIMNLTSGSFGFEDLDIGTNNLRDHAGLESYYASSHGFELQLANSVEGNAFPDNPQVHLIKTGHGGSRVSEWNVGGTYWNKFLQRIDAGKTQLGADRQWVVWMSLGINDSIGGTPTSTWKTAMVAHINKIKAELPGAIVILTEFQSMPAGSGYPAYNAVIRELAAEQPNVFSVDTTGAGTDGANHWLYAGMKQVTQSMVDVTRTQLGLLRPGTPAGLVATPGQGQVTLRWSSPAAAGASSVTDYLVDYKRSSDSAYQRFSDGVSTATGTTVTGLLDGAAYDFRVSAYSSAGSGNAAAGSTTTLPDASAPTVSGVTVAPSQSGATIAWTTDEAGTSQVAYGIGTINASSSLDSALTTSHSVTLTGLTACTAYAFRAVSADAGGNAGVSADATFLTSCAGATRPIEFASADVATSTGATTTLTGSGQTLTLGIPAGFATGPAHFQLKQVDAAGATGATAVPAGLRGANGYLYDLKAFTATGTAMTSFLRQLTVTIPYDPSARISGALAIWRFDGSSWTQLSGCSTDASAHTVTCLTDHFSLFGVFGSPLSSSGSRSRSTSASTRVRNLLANGSVAEARELQALLPEVFPSAPASTSAPAFSRDLALGAQGEDVRQLQQLLNRKGFPVAASGPGSAGSETTLFGPATKAALARFQARIGIVPASGVLGPLTRAALAGAVTSAPAVIPLATPVFSRDLALGAQGEDVRQLQQLLNRKGFPVAASGPGSAGSETTMFGYATQAAVKAWQASVGISPATGYFGAASRAAILR